MQPLATLSLKEWGSGIIVVALLITLALLGNFLKSNAQRERPDPRDERTQERVIQKKTNSAIPNEPVAITLVKTKKGVVEAGKTFKDADNDWTRGLTLTAQNISQRTITYIDVTFSFERPRNEANSNQPTLVETLIFGSLKATPNEVKLRPGESTDLVLRDSRHDVLMNVLAEAGYSSNVKHIKFYLSQVVFEDGTMWSLGYWYQRDRTNPDNWIKIPDVGKRGGPQKNVPGNDRVALRSHAGAAGPQLPPNPCQDPGFPFWQTCTGAGSQNCRKKVQPTSPSQFLRSHRDKAQFVACKQCINPTPSSLECDAVPHCTDVVIQFSTLPELCVPANQTDCEALSWFWNPISDFCQEEAPPPCYDEPVVCDPGSWSFTWCGCIPYSSPILVDVSGNGFNLTNSTDGVSFNLNTIGGVERLAWTSARSDDAWLVLDRNGNEMIDDGTELFGDVTSQPEPAAGQAKNGFLALAVYDSAANGGNNDGVIDRKDAIFASLRLWQDVNHNAFSESNELRTLTSSGVATIELDYKVSKKTDQFGNLFRYRAKVKDSKGNQLGRWAWDVYPVR